MWCATGILAIVAVVLIFTGKPETSPATDEAPQWQPAFTETAGTNPPAVASAMKGTVLIGQPAESPGAMPPVDAASPAATNGPPSGPTGPFPWREQGTAGQTAVPGGYLNDAGSGTVPRTGAPGGELPPTNQLADPFPTDIIPGTAPAGGNFPNGNVPAGVVPGAASPSGAPANGAPPAEADARNFYQPGMGPSGPAGFGDPNGPPPDQSKLQTGLRTATRPGSPGGGVRLDGDIHNLGVRPRDDSSR
jgi:hypothetical protein